MNRIYVLLEREISESQSDKITGYTKDYEVAKAHQRSVSIHYNYSFQTTSEVEIPSSLTKITLPKKTFDKFIHACENEDAPNQRLMDLFEEAKQQGWIES